MEGKSALRRLTEILRYCEITGKGIDEREKMR